MCKRKDCENSRPEANIEDDEVDGSESDVDNEEDGHGVDNEWYFVNTDFCLRFVCQFCK